MSEKNVAALEAIVGSLNRGATHDALALMSPDCELDLSRNQGDWAGIYIGHDRILELLGVLGDAWHQMQIEIRETSAAGDDLVAPVALHFRGRDGIIVTARANWLCTFRDGLALRIASYNELDDALADAGLGSPKP